MQIIPPFYQSCLSHQLSATQLLTLEILVWLLQAHKQVRLERRFGVISHACQE
ncbi:MAG: hypothetical protein ICV54_22740 [Nostoc sp. C3-bin3]|nr:hypothetical protein [Nostoc sp. C3-bin3]